MKTDLKVSITVFIFSFLLYGFTANPDVTFTDSGELAGVCVFLGVAHPTGYPLFTILGYLWSLIPNPFELIFWLNLFASFATALSAAIFSLIVCELLRILKLKMSNYDIFQIAFIISAIYVFAKTIWAQGLALEVYSLQLVMFNLIILSVLKVFNSDKPDRWLIITAFVTGLGFSNHMTTILTVPGLLIVYLMIKNEKSNLLNNKLKTFFILLIPFFAGISLYLTLPLISSGEPAFNWGAVHRGWDKFLYHIQGKQYQIWMFSGSESAIKNLGIFFTSVPYQMGWIGLLLSLPGVYFAFKQNRLIAVFLLVILFSSVLYSINYSIHDIEPYFNLAFISLILFITFSVKYIYENKKTLYKYIIVIPIISLALNIQTNYRSGDVLVKEYMTILVSELEEDAVILTAQWDYWNSAFWYYQAVEDYRPDVKLIEKELLRRTWYPIQLRNWYPELCDKCEVELSSYEEQLELFESEGAYNPVNIQKRFENLLSCFIESNINNVPVYLTLDVVQTEPNLIKNYQLIPEGFAFRVLPKGDAKQPSLNIESLVKFKKAVKKYNSGHLEEGIAISAAMNIVNIARLFYAQGNIEQAKIYFNEALEIDPENQLAIQGLNQINNY